MQETASELYLRNRLIAREGTRAEFLSQRPGIDIIVATANELVARLAFVISGRDLRRVENGLYIGDLLVSFCRSHFVASDLLCQGEMIEAATLLRKQMELIGRLNELSAGVTVDALVGKTPNVRHLSDGLRKRYGEYSEIAHSSNPRSLELLGTLSEEGNRYTPLYPMFDDNLYAGLAHQLLVALDFVSWTIGFYSREFADYDATQDRLLREALATSWFVAFERPKPV